MTIANESDENFLGEFRNGQEEQHKHDEVDSCAEDLLDTIERFI